ncbi:MAG: PadR family transcriptional regulator [Proteocatella sp.]
MRDNVKGGALTEVTFFILLSLYIPKHGYAIMQFVEEKTGGRLTLGAGSLYGAINSLLEKNWISPYETAESENSLKLLKNVRKKEYQITELGKAVAENELERLRELIKISDEIIRGGSYEQ